MAGQVGKRQARTTRTWVPIAVATAAACVFAALVAVALAVGGDAQTAARTSVPTTDAFTSFSRLTAGFAVIGVPAIAAWGISINHRCINVTVRRVLLAIVALMEVWLIGACVASVAFGLDDPPLIAIAVVSDLVIMLFIESYIDARILPSIHRYRTLFRHLPLDLKILNDGGRVIYKTDIARPLDNTTLWRLANRTPDAAGAAKAKGSGKAKTSGKANAPTPIETVLSVQIESLPGTVFKIFALNAGTAVLTEDAAERIRLQQRLEKRHEQLSSQNEILRHNHAMQSLLYRQQRERKLGERVERDLAATAAQIRRILDNRVTGTGPEVRAERLQQLNLVKVLVAYSKRKGMLALAAAESDTLTGEQLGVIAREAMADLHSIGIECAVLVESAAPIAVAAFNTVYDGFYDCILSVLPRTNPVVMTYITTRGDGVLEMRAVIECGMGLSSEDDAPAIPQVATSTATWTAMQMDIARDLEGRLAMRGGDFAVTLDEGLVNVKLRVGAGESGTGAMSDPASAPASPPAPFTEAGER